MNYKETLNLPSTKFSMKANLQVREPEIQKWWEEINVYKKIREKRNGGARYILHDGPPYANGATHIGTALNKILKDIIVKYKSSRGFDAPYVPGWDCHGLPIELAVMKALGGAGGELSGVEIRKKCAEHAGKFINIQMDEFKRLGVFGDWERPYLTMNPEYEAKEIELFGLLFKRGFIHRSFRPIHWCVHCKTALAEAEIEYGTHKSPSIYIRFPVKTHPFSDLCGELPVSLFVWTTTPWTLLANTAVAVQPSFRYAFVKIDKKEIFIMLTELVTRVMEETGIKDYEIIGERKGDEIAPSICQHPFIDRKSSVVTAEFVTKEEGTGCVHSAPAHGQDDFYLGQKHKLPLINPVDEEGKFTDTAGEEFAGLFIFDANDKVIEKLKQVGALVHSNTITHSYPHCWRCREPLITRATKQWFISMDNLRDEVASEADKIKWIPLWGKLRITNMIKNRPDWCISRQRVWGVPIPAFYCKKCDELLINEEIIASACGIIHSGGSSAWAAEKEENLLPPGTACRKCSGSEFRKETDIFDVWFDSGVSYYAVVMAREGLGGSSELYLEGNDQYRGWFQTTLLASVGAGHGAPYKSVLTHGFMVDGEGKKMSKSLGNLIATSDVIDSYGADILRLWVISENYQEDIRFSSEILERIKDSYRRFRNTCRFILGNISDFSAENEVKTQKLEEIDKWALTRLNNFLRRVACAYEEFAFHKIYQELYNFCVVELGSLYFDIIKDRLYTFAGDSRQRRSAQTVLYKMLSALVRAVSPVLPYTCEEIWGIMRHTDGESVSVHLADWPSESPSMDSSAEADWNKLMKIKEEVNQFLEKARMSGLIGSSLEAKLVLQPHHKDIDDFFKKFYNELPVVCIVSCVEVLGVAADEVSAQSGFAVRVEKASGEKCQRCWRYCKSVGEDKEYSAICERCMEVIQK